MGKREVLLSKRGKVRRQARGIVADLLNISGTANRAAYILFDMFHSHDFNIGNVHGDVFDSVYELKEAVDKLHRIAKSMPEDGTQALEEWFASVQPK